ncbi:MAG: single-stranded-DNA-specific exonuclease RecJ, partial [Boseongicola sp. SB0676_bin_33]|nr:single-stranded-DNA-specific exonuclease RecJ [Boseongicola sp. SB0676_bin_33]
MADALEQETLLPAALCRILADRGVPAENVGQFLDPKLRDLLPDPRSFRDIDIVAGRLVRALADKERIAVFADYDVDGGASAALLLDWLEQLGHDATLYVPDRIAEGYGPNPSAMRRLAGSHGLIVCVDCGTHSFDAISAAQETDVLVIDHHLASETLPGAFGIVNPSRQDESGDFAHLCAAAVTFIVLVEANRQLRAGGREGPDLMDMLDLVALATIADVVPLQGVNRAIVRQGLHVMRARKRPGLAALADVARLTAPPNAYHLGYILGPCVNAGGRIGRADLGARCLSARDPDEARALADLLD